MNKSTLYSITVQNSGHGLGSDQSAKNGLKLGTRSGLVFGMSLLRLNRAVQCVVCSTATSSRNPATSVHYHCSTMGPHGAFLGDLGPLFLYFRLKNASK